MRILMVVCRFSWRRMTEDFNGCLPIQLEKIRAAENEVRWQHEDDVEECSNCRQAFTVTKRKVRKP